MCGVAGQAGDGRRRDVETQVHECGDRKEQHQQKGGAANEIASARGGVAKDCQRKREQNRCQRALPEEMEQRPAKNINRVHLDISSSDFGSY